MWHREAVTTAEMAKLTQSMFDRADKLRDMEHKPHKLVKSAVKALRKKSGESCKSYTVDDICNTLGMDQLPERKGREVARHFTRCVAIGHSHHGRLVGDYAVLSRTGIEALIKAQRNDGHVP